MTFGGFLTYTRDASAKGSKHKYDVIFKRNIFFYFFVNFLNGIMGSLVSTGCKILTEELSLQKVSSVKSIHLFEVGEKSYNSSASKDVQTQ